MIHYITITTWTQHMTLCRGQADLNDGMTLEAGLQKEDCHFRKKDPWAKEFAKSPEKFGIPNLRNKLASVQLRLIKESIPAILQDISKEMELAQADCKTLGTAISNPTDRRNYFTTLYSTAMESVKGHLEGRFKLKASTKTLLSKQHEAFEEFAEKILATRLANIVKFDVGTRVEVTFQDGSIEFGKVTSMSRDGKVVGILPDDIVGDNKCLGYKGKGSQ